MNSFLPFIITGVTTGAVYGLAGSGLVITYRTSGVFNFAHGAIAAAAAYFFYWLTVDRGVDWEIAFILSVPVLGIVLGLLLELVGRHIVRRTAAMQIVATVGVILIVQAIATVKFGPDPLELDQYLPGGAGTFRLGGVNIEWAQLIVTCVAVAATAAIYFFFRHTRLGLAMRAVVDDADVVGLHGTSPVRVRRVAWIIGSTLASASGVLLAPFVGVDSITLTYLVVAAIGAASIGGFSSIPLTYIGGLVLGIAADISQKYVLNVSWLSGLPLSLPFLALLIALLVLPRRRLAANSVVERRLIIRERAPGPFLAGTAIVVIVVLLLIPTLVGTHLPYFMQGITLGIMLLSLGLLVRTSGQVSLCHAAFAAIGAVAFSQFMSNLHLPWLLALLLGALVVVPVAALVALPAIRLTGLFLGLATLAFGIMVERLIYPLSFAFGDSGAGRSMPRPSWASSDPHFYYLLVALLVLTAAIMFLIDRSRLGRMLRGLSESPKALQTMGLTVSSTKVLVFCISGFFAGLSGILYGSTVSYASYVDPHYTSFQSLVLLAILAVAPLGAPWYAIFAIPVAVIPGYITSSNVNSWLNLVFGVFAVVVALQGGAPPTPQWLTTVLHRWSRPTRVAPGAPDAVAPVVSVVSGTRRDSSTAPGLGVRDLRVRFGGLVAVDGVSLEAPIGRVTGLIGPNGAGKTTTFNACSGLVRPDSGQVSLHGEDVTRLSAQARGRLGLGRTFQVTQLCESLTVRQNVAMGREAALAGWNPISQLGLVRTRAQRSETASADEALTLCGIEHLADVPAGTLSTGEGRLVELARALAGGFDVLLLDEPSAGLDSAESERLRTVLETVMSRRRCAILLVEHDMAFVMRLCDYIYVLDFGKSLFEGTPDAVASSPTVQAAYLGSSDMTPTAMAVVEPVQQGAVQQGEAMTTVMAVSSPATAVSSPDVQVGGPPALSVSRVKVGYGRTTILRDVSLEVAAGSVTALVGPNGAGKSTLLNMISGLLPARAGQVRLFGEDITGLQHFRRARLGLCHVPEGRAIYRSLTVRENLRIQAAPGTEHVGIERAVSAFPTLGKRLRQTAGTMSGGEQQMLAMAAAYVRDVRLIIVDEPSLGLSPVMVDSMYEFLESVAKSGIALLLVDQYVSRALTMAGAVYVMRRGEIVYQGEPRLLIADDLFEHYIGS